MTEDQIVPFSVTPEFTRTFGPVPDFDDFSYKVSNIDGLFENLMITETDGDEQLYCLDYVSLISRFLPVLYSTAIWLISIINTGA